MLEAKEGRYDTGQLFLHRIFGYRGVILFPWTARVYDRDLHNTRKQTPTATPTPCPTEASPFNFNTGNSDNSGTPAAAHSNDAPTAWHANKNATDTQGTTAMGTAKPATNTSASNSVDAKEVKGKTQTFYQVLIDTRDCPYIVSYLYSYQFNN